MLRLDQTEFEIRIIVAHFGVAFRLFFAFFNVHILEF